MRLETVEHHRPGQALRRFTRRAAKVAEADNLVLRTVDRAGKADSVAVSADLAVPVASVDQAGQAGPA